MTLSHTWLGEVLEQGEGGELLKDSIYVAMAKSSCQAELSFLIDVLVLRVAMFL